MIKLHKFDIQKLSFGVTVNEICFKIDGIWKSPFKASIFMINPGCTSPVDCHDVNEVWIIVDGFGTFVSSGKNINVSENEVIYIPSNEEHSIINTGNADLKIISLWWSNTLKA